MHDPLAPLLADGVIDAVLSRLKSGKEADLWLVQHRDEVLAAKVYKARQERSFKNNAAYTEGRQVRNTRTQRAMDRGSRFGRAAAEEAWKAKEADALHALHAAGVRVPRPVIFYEGVLLMELVVDAAGHPAPRLVDATIPAGQAAALYADLRAQAVRMLACDLVHGDLSPFNVLLAWNGPTVIDFPQVVGAAHNRQAERFFERDLEALRRFFASLDPALQAAAGDAREIWRAYERRELTPDFVPSGRPPPAARPPGPRQAVRDGAREAPRRERQPHEAQRSHPPHQASRSPAPHQAHPPPSRQAVPDRPAGAGQGHGQRQAHGQPRTPGPGQPHGHGQRREPERAPRPASPRDGRPPPRDRPRQGGGGRPVVVERLGPRAPTPPSSGSPGAPPGGGPSSASAHGGRPGSPSSPAAGSPSGRAGAGAGHAHDRPAGGRGDAASRGQGDGKRRRRRRSR